MFENPRRSRQARKFTTNVPKILDLKSSCEQIFFRKLSLGAPGLFEAGLRLSRVSPKFELRYESLKNKSSLILFAYNLMTGYSKRNRENYPRECF